MTRRRHWIPPALLTAMAVSAALAIPAGAAEIWSGRTLAFSKPAFGSPAIITNQDRIRPTYWITRGNTQGIFNAALESGFLHNVSPKDTEWSNGDAVNYPLLTFQTWDAWSGDNPPSKVGVNAVMHLIADDIYIDVVFDRWGQGPAGGGAFTYHRGEKPLVTPTQSTSWGRIKHLYH